MKISIIIPAFNEAKRIGASIHTILDYLTSTSWTYEIIVIDDGSTDSTFAVVKTLKNKYIKLVSYNPNRGKGYAVHQGLCQARFDLVLFTDADLSTPIQDIERLLPFARSYDVVIGSRNLPNSIITKPQPFVRSRLGKTFPFLVKLLLLPGIADTQCGFKLFNRKAIELIIPRQTLHDFGFDVEILYICRQAGLSIKEVGIQWGNAQGSKVRIFRDSLRMFFDIWKIKLRQIQGRYSLPGTPLDTQNKKIPHKFTTIRGNHE